MLDGDPKLLSLSTVLTTRHCRSCDTGKVTRRPIACVSSWVEPKPQRTEKLEKETPLTLPISLIADGKWRSSASGFGVLNRHTPRHDLKIPSGQ